MIPFGKYTVILFLLHYFHNDGFAADFPFYNVQVEPLFSQLSFSSNHENVFYVTCNKIIYTSFQHLRPQGSKTSYCNFHLQTQTSSGSYVRNCYNVLVRYVGIFGTYVPKFIDDEKVLIKHSTVDSNDISSPTITKYKILDFSDCTFKRSLEIPLSVIGEVDFVYVTVANNKIDIFVSNETLCEVNDHLCQISYNLQGEQITKPTFFPRGQVYHVAQVNDQEPGKGRYLNRAQDSKWIISHIDSTGRNNQIFSTDSKNKINGEIDLSTEYTNSYELYGLCFPHTIVQLHLNQEYQAISITCLQFDTQGKTLQATLEVDKTSLAIAAYNLPNNEMLLATANVEETNTPNAVIGSINIYKIDKNHSTFKSLLIRGLNLKYRFSTPPHPKFEFVKMSISERPNDEICVHVASISPFQTTKGLEYGPLQYDVKCISKQKLLDLNL